MTKDTKGLLKYLLTMAIIWLMPLCIIYYAFGALYYEDNNKLLFITYIIITTVLFILYLIMPVIFTYKAMTHHWSKYLDKFLFNKWIPTVIFITLIFLQINIPSEIAKDIIDLFIAPIYYFTYITLSIISFFKFLFNKKIQIIIRQDKKKSYLVLFTIEFTSSELGYLKIWHKRALTQPAQSRLEFEQL